MNIEQTKQSAERYEQSLFHERGIGRYDRQDIINAYCKGASDERENTIVVRSDNSKVIENLQKEIKTLKENTVEFYTFRDIEFVKRIPTGVSVDYMIYQVDELTVPLNHIHAVYKTKSGRYIADLPMNFTHHYNEVRITESDYNKLTEIFSKKHIAVL